MVSINLHFKEISFNLGLIEVNQISCTSDVLLSLIKNKLNEFRINLNSKKVIATADGASVNSKLETISNIFLQKCQNHAINLSIIDTFYANDSVEKIESVFSDEDYQQEENDCSDDEDESESEEGDDIDDKNSNTISMPIQSQYKESIKKARNISNIIRNSPTMKRILLKYTDSMPLKDSKTRWSSLAKMTDRFLEILPQIKKTFIDAKKNLDFAETDYEYLKHIQILLYPVIDVVEKLSNSKANLLTADIEMSKLIIKLKNINENNNEFKYIKKKFVTNLEQRFLARRRNTSNVLQYLLSSKFNTNDNLFYTEPSNQNIKQCYEDFCTDIDQNSNNSLAEQNDLSSETNFDSLNVNLDDFTAKKMKSSIDFEIEEFEKTKKLGTDLLSLARVLLSVKATSTDIERTF